MTLSRRALMAAGLATLASGARATGPFPDELGQRRLFIVFADRPDNDRLQRQLALTATANFTRRDLSLVEVVGEGPIRVDGETRSEPTASSLRRTYRVAGDFAVRLVGKDGGVKLETGRIVNMDELFELVDSMPMRQQEMRARGES